MNSNWTILLTSAAALSLPIVSLPKPAMKSIAIVPALSPVMYSLENRNIVLGRLFPWTQCAYRASNASKTVEFSKSLAAPQFSPGHEFTTAVAVGLRGRGYVVQVLENVARDPVNPAEINYDKLQFDADAVLHLYFSEIGLYSPPSSPDYLPRVNAGGRVFVKGRPDYLYNETLCFGVDARPGKGWAIVADEKLAFPNFEFVLNNIDVVRNAFSTGVQEVSKRMSEQVHAALK